MPETRKKNIPHSNKGGIPLQKAGNPWILFVMFFIIISVTLVARHCYPETRVVQQSRHQYWRKVPLKTTRGIIQDVKGNALVISETIPSFAIDPSLIQSDDLPELEQIISDDLMIKIRAAMGTKSRFMWLTHKSDEAEAEKFKAVKKDIKALIEIDEPYRKYTNQRLMSHVLGFCDADNRGLAGIEQKWDYILYNPPGQKIVVRRPGTQPALLFDRGIEQKNVMPIITLTLDSRIQYVVEKHLFQTAKNEKAKWAVAVCIDPNTGEVVASASYPSYDPQNRKSLKNQDPRK